MLRRRSATSRRKAPAIGRAGSTRPGRWAVSRRNCALLCWTGNGHLGNFTAIDGASKDAIESRSTTLHVAREDVYPRASGGNLIGFGSQAVVRFGDFGSANGVSPQPR